MVIASSPWSLDLAVYVIAVAPRRLTPRSYAMIVAATRKQRTFVFHWFIVVTGIGEAVMLNVTWTAEIAVCPPRRKRSS
jgi:hypothetical protein